MPRFHLTPLNPPAAQPHEYPVSRHRRGLVSGYDAGTQHTYRFICSLPAQSAWPLLLSNFPLIRYLTSGVVPNPPQRAALPSGILIVAGKEKATLEALFLLTCLARLRFTGYLHPDTKDLFVKFGDEIRAVVKNYKPIFALYGLHHPLIGCMLLELRETLFKPFNLLVR